MTTRSPAPSFSRMGAGLTGSAIRQMGALAAGKADLISLAPGYPDASVLSDDAWPAIAQHILAPDQRATTLQYAETRGYAPLIETLITRLRGRGIEATSTEVMLTTGSQQAVDLIARLFVDPGDTVLVELPTFTGAIAAFRNAGAHLAGVRQEADGLDLAHLDAVLASERAEGRVVRFLYLIPNFQNPTGGLLSLEKRAALLAWSAREDVLIVEDDPYGDLWFAGVTRPEETRPLKADDGDGRVIHLQSTSKTLAPAFRTGWVVAPAAIVERLEVAKQSADLCSSLLDQRFVHEAIVRGVLDARLPRLREIYGGKCQRLIDAIERHGHDVLTSVPPRGGFFVWATAPEGVDAMALVRTAIDAGVIYVPGGPFFVDGSGASCLRLAFSSATPDTIDEGIRRLAGVIRTAASAPPLRPATS